MALFRTGASTGQINSFTVSGSSGATIGTNFKVGAYYFFLIYANAAVDMNTLFTNSSAELVSSNFTNQAGKYLYQVAFKANNSTVTISTSVGNQFNPLEIIL